MNGPCQEIQDSGKHIPEERKHHIMMLLARIVHQRLTASRPERMEGVAKKEHERQGAVRVPPIH